MDSNKALVKKLGTAISSNWVVKSLVLQDFRLRLREVYLGRRARLQTIVIYGVLRDAEYLQS